MGQPLHKTAEVMEETNNVDENREHLSQVKQESKSRDDDFEKEDEDEDDDEEITNTSAPLNQHEEKKMSETIGGAAFSNGNLKREREDEEENCEAVPPTSRQKTNDSLNGLNRKDGNNNEDKTFQTYDKEINAKIAGDDSTNASSLKSSEATIEVTATGQLGNPLLANQNSGASQFAAASTEAAATTTKTTTTGDLANNNNNNSAALGNNIPMMQQAWLMGHTIPDFRMLALFPQQQQQMQQQMLAQQQQQQQMQRQRQQITGGASSVPDDTQNGGGAGQEEGSSVANNDNSSSTTNNNSVQASQVNPNDPAALQQQQQQHMAAVAAFGHPAGLMAGPMGFSPFAAQQMILAQRAGMFAGLSHPAAAAAAAAAMGNPSSLPMGGGSFGRSSAAVAMMPNLTNPGGSSAAVAAALPSSPAISLSLACDDEHLSEYQILVRKQLEIFEAQPEDVESNTQGRKKQVSQGQVGIRCRHCASLPLRQRGRGAVYYPAKLQGVYQAAQNMASSHLCESCQCIDATLKRELRALRERRDTASGGKQYWADGARALGLYEAEDGLRLGRTIGP